MRIILSLKTKENSVLNYNYQYYITSWIYSSLKKEFSNKLHNNENYKFFTFSEILIRNRENTKEGIKLTDGKAILIISSPRDEFIKEIAKSILDRGKLRIKDIEFNIEKMKISDTPENIEFLKTISPIYVSTRVNNKKIDLYPNNSKFFENLKKNLVKKFINFYNKEPEGNIEFEVLNYKPKRLKIKDHYYRCSHMIFRVEGDKELIKFSYDCGFGSRNSMGFGCVEIYK